MDGRALPKITTRNIPPNCLALLQVCLYSYSYLTFTLIPLFTGLVYTYLAEGTGNVTGRGAFRALQRGFNHWSSGRVSHIEVNIENSQFYHVRCRTTPSMKPGAYHVYILLRHENELVIGVERATCQCAAG